MIQEIQWCLRPVSASLNSFLIFSCSEFDPIQIQIQMPASRGFCFTPVCMLIIHIALLSRDHCASAFFPKLSSTPAFVACPKAPTNPQDRRINTHEVKVSTFNVEFLFEKNLGTLDCPGKSCKWKNAGHAQDHMNAVAQVIRDLDTDILVLNEVEDCEALEHLIDAIGDDSYRPYLIRGTDSFTAQQVGLITRVDPMQDLRRNKATVNFPVPNSRCPAESERPLSTKRSPALLKKFVTKAKGVSKHLYTRFNITGLDAPLTLVGVHFLAQPQNRKRCFEREAQAMVIAELIDEAAYIGDSVVVLGDFNDFSATTPDIQNSMPISGVHEILQEAGWGLRNVAKKLPKAKRYSAWWDKRNRCQYKVPDEVSQLDHILLSRELFDQITHVDIGHKLFDQGCDTLVSDHFPVSVKIATTQG